jgi:hypothetical protein
MRTYISTVVLDDLQAKFSVAPATEESERQNEAQLLLLSCLDSEKQEPRFLLLLCHTPP